MAWCQIFSWFELEVNKQVLFLGKEKDKSIIFLF